jgi:hypothetical protein
MVLTSRETTIRAHTIRGNEPALSSFTKRFTFLKQFCMVLITPRLEVSVRELLGFFELERASDGTEGSAGAEGDVTIGEECSGASVAMEDVGH